MIPKEKAKELVDKFAMYLRANLRYDEEANEEAKQCALISVDEILQSNSNINIFISSKDVKYKNKAETEVKSDCKENLKYWQEVKQEIKNIS